MSFNIIEGDVRVPGNNGTNAIRAPGDVLSSGDSGIIVLGQDGSTARILALDASGAIYIRPKDSVSLIARATGITPALNKNMGHLLNSASSPVVIRIIEIWVQPSQTTAVSGVPVKLECKRFTAVTGSTAGVIKSFDTTVSSNIHISCGSAGTLEGEEDDFLFRKFYSSDEWGSGTLDLEGEQMLLSGRFPLWKMPVGGSPIVLRAGQGLSWLCRTATNTGTLDIDFVFVQE
jgi:hypothetical protein